MRKAISRGQWQPQTAVSPLLRQSHMWELLAGNRTAVPPRHAHKGGSRVTSRLKQGAHLRQPTAWPLPHACAKPYHVGSGSHGQLFRPYWGSSAWHCRRSVTGGGGPVFFSVFPAPPATDPVVQWSVQWPNDITILTEPECNGSAKQRLKEGTPVRQNRTGIQPAPPETLPAQGGS